MKNNQPKIMQVTKEQNCLLIGNSRWHWAIQKGKEWSFLHTPPDPNKLKSLEKSLSKWAAVGPIPKGIYLDPSKCIKLKHIPLNHFPKWIGIDRALVAWAAFEKAKSKNIHTEGLLIADAGTILSITCINSKGEFLGGQLMAGLKLQRSIISSGGEQLNPVQSENLPKNQFPISTEEAILRGSFQSLLGALIEAKKESKKPLWLCGGDSELLFKYLKHRIYDLKYYPDLILEAMVNLNLKAN